MKFGAVVLRYQLKSPKAAIIRAGKDIVSAEGPNGVPAGDNPSLKLREEVCRKLADAVRNGANSVELKVKNGVIVETPDEE